MGQKTTKYDYSNLNTDYDLAYEVFWTDLSECLIQSDFNKAITLLKDNTKLSYKKSYHKHNIYFWLVINIVYYNFDKFNDFNNLLNYIEENSQLFPVIDEKTEKFIGNIVYYQTDNKIRFCLDHSHNDSILSNEIHVYHSEITALEMIAGYNKPEFSKLNSHITLFSDRLKTFFNKLYTKITPIVIPAQIVINPFSLSNGF
jgi:hypothetical protein